MRKVSNKKRNWLMRQPETFMISKTSCFYFGKKYYFNLITVQEEIKLINKVLKWTEYWNKPWLYRIFHKGPEP